MEMAIQPAQAVLDGDMEIPEAVDFWDLDTPPDGRLDSLQGDPELEDVLEAFWASVGGLRGFFLCWILNHRSPATRWAIPTFKVSVV